MPTRSSWLDRTIGLIAPGWQLQRTRARVARDLLLRHYEGAESGRRTQGWKRTSGDPNAVAERAIGLLRDHARDLARNNPIAEAAVETITDHVIGWGIVPQLKDLRLAALWKAWAETTACDADGRSTLSGLLSLAVRALVTDGEVLIRRRVRRPEDGWPVPLQLQILEADHLDTEKTAELEGGRRVIQGVEFDAIGARTAYWLFPAHPGAGVSAGGRLTTASKRIPASEILHVFLAKRPGQVRGVSWFSSVLLRLKDLDVYEDATLMKQKIAACLAVITSDTDGSTPALGTADDTSTPPVDSLEPGAVINVPPGRSVTVVDPPAVGEYAEYVKSNQRTIAKGLGLAYEDLTGDYTGLPFSAARMSRLAHWARVDKWRWQVVIPQACDPIWGWFSQVVSIQGLTPPASVEWTTTPMPMIEPDKEGLAYSRNIRNGIITWPEAVRERGYDPETLLEEIAATNAQLDALGIVLDCDPRRMTQAGQSQASLSQGPQPNTDPEPTEAEAES